MAICDIDGCTTSVRAKGGRCGPHRTAYGNTKESLRIAELGKQDSKDNHAKKKKAGICSKCTKPVKPGKTCCVDCLDKHARDVAANRARAAEEERCLNLSCPNPKHPTSGYCPAHRDSYNQAQRERFHEAIELGLCTRGGCYYPLPEDYQWRICEDCRDRKRESDAKQRVHNSSDRLHSELSILEALDLKHDYIISKLKNIVLPDTSFRYVYCDSEARSRKQDFRDCKQVDEWTFLDFAADQPNMSHLKSAAFLPTDKDVKDWAGVIAQKLQDRCMVMYGNGRCDQLRASSYFTKHNLKVRFTVFEPMSDLFTGRSKLFSTNPDDEYEPNAPIYLPQRSLAYIFKAIGRNMKDRRDVYRNWFDCASFPEFPASYKSAPDTIMLFEFLRILREKKSGVRFSQKYASAVVAQPVAGPSSAVSLLPSVKRPLVPIGLSTSPNKLQKTLKGFFTSAPKRKAAGSEDEGQH